MTPSPRCRLRRLPAYVAITLVLTLAAATSASAQWTGEIAQVTFPGNIFSPKVAVGPGGLTTVVWDGYADNPSRNLIQVSQLPTIGASPTANQSVTNINENGMNHSIAADPAGNTFVVWPWDSGNGAAKMRRVDNQGNMSPEQTISQSGVPTSDHDVAADANGNAAVVWYESNPSGGTTIMLSYIDASLQASAPFTLAVSGSGESVTDPVVEFDSAGNAVVVHMRRVASGSTLEAIAFSPQSGTVTSRVIVSEPSGDWISTNSVDVNGDGDVIVGYALLRPVFNPLFFFTFQTISSNVMRLDAGSSTASAIDLDIAGYAPYAPHVKFYSDDSAVLAFRATTDNVSNGYLAPIDSNGIVGTPMATTVGVGQTSTTMLEVGGDDVATFLWTEAGNSAYQLFARQLPRGGTISEAEALMPNGNVSELSLATGADGLVAVAFVDYNTNTIYVTNNVPTPVCSDAAEETSGGNAATFSLNCASTTSQTVSVASDPLHGDLQLNDADGEVTYTPDAGFEGADQFTFRSSNAYGDSQVATFDVTVVNNLIPTPPPPPGPAQPSTLVVSQLGVSRSFLPMTPRFRRAVRASFSITTAASVKIVVARRYGRKLRGHCRLNHRTRRPVKRCRVRRVAFTIDAGELAAGRHTVSLPEAQIRRSLRPGSYLVSVTASAGSQTSLAMRELRVNWRRDR